jgi:hypothetical protein
VGRVFADLMEMLNSAIENTAALILFAFVVLAAFLFAMVLVMIFLLMVRAAFRWATRRAWGDVIVSAERKALRGR